jgi:hypothetical protein
MKVGEFLQQDRVVYHYLQNPATDRPGPRVGRVLGADRLGPGLLQVQPSLPSAPAAGREQLGEDLAEPLRPLPLRVTANRHLNSKEEEDSPQRHKGHKEDQNR